jgi:hypothetical protein
VPKSQQIRKKKRVSTSSNGDENTQNPTSANCAERPFLQRVAARVSCVSDVGHLVLQSWLRSSYDGGMFRGDMTRDEYFEYMSPVCEGLLRIGQLFIVEVDGEILGWSLFSEDEWTLHYVYVKKYARKQGVGRLLAPPGFRRHTFWTRYAEPLVRGSRWMPWALIG